MSPHPRLARLLVALAFTLLPARVRAANADDCNLRWKSHHTRGNVKTRTAAAGARYTEFNNGEPITVDQWFQYVCSPGFNNLVPAKVDARPSATPIPDAETIHVKLQGYLLAAQFKKKEDHDLHAELSATPAWNSDHLIVEVPPGQEYCAARKALWSLVVNDPAQLRRQTKVLNTPVEVVVDGYIFLDYAGKHTHHKRCTNPGSHNWCDRNAFRGIRQKFTDPSEVRGCWELHPIFSMQAAH